MAMHMRDAPPEIRELVAWIPANLATLVMSLLRNEPVERPNMAQVAAALTLLAERFGNIRLGETLPLPPKSATVETVASSGASASTLGNLQGQSGPAQKAGRPSRLRGLGATAAFAVSLKSGARRRGQEAHRPAPSPRCSTGAIGDAADSDQRSQ